MSADPQALAQAWDEWDEIAQRLTGSDMADLPELQRAAIFAEYLHPGTDPVRWELEIFAMTRFKLSYLDPAMSVEMRARCAWDSLLDTFSRFHPPITLDPDPPAGWTPAQGIDIEE